MSSYLRRLISVLLAAAVLVASSTIWIGLFMVTNYSHHDKESKLNSPPKLSPDKNSPPPNVLFLITDQQRFDTIRRVQDELPHYANGTKIQTPNLDRLSRQGAYFRNTYCQCSVCAPARTTLRTGCTVERTGIQSNFLAFDYDDYEFFNNRVEALTDLDHVLVSRGYVSEYYGKWHMPEAFAYPNDSDDNDDDSDDDDDDSSNIIQYNDYDYAKDEFLFLDDFSVKSMIGRYLHYFESIGRISKDFSVGQQSDTFTEYAYTPIEMDSRYGYATGTALTEENGFVEYLRTQPNICGVSSLSEDYTPSHFIGDVGIKALDRLVSGDKPFFLTVSFHHPHTPLVAARKYVDYYWTHRDNLVVPPNIHDDMKNSAYYRDADDWPKYEDETKVKEWTALYYALIEEIDDHVGMLLDHLGDATDNTLIIFTSDHGEMLGSHGMREKNNFYEESARVPLFMSFPGRIPTDTTVNEFVSHLDVFSTILDYVGAADEDHSDGSSLRPLIEKTFYNQEFEQDVVFAEWDFREPLETNLQVLEDHIDEKPSFMVRKGSFKLMMHKLAASEKMDMMYDFRSDPFEMNNLLGMNALKASKETLSKAEHLRCLLLEWMERMDSDEGYFSDPMANYGEGDGDITEIRQRQPWPALDFWVGDSEIEFGPSVWNGSHFVRNEYLYFGTRTAGEPVVVSVSIVGSDATYFSVDKNEATVNQNQCQSVKVMFASPTSCANRQKADAAIRLRREGAADTIVQLSLPKNRKMQEGHCFRGPVSSEVKP